MGIFRRAAHEKAGVGRQDSENESIRLPVPAFSPLRQCRKINTYLMEVISNPTATFSQYRVTVALVSPSGTT